MLCATTHVSFAQEYLANVAVSVVEDSSDAAMLRRELEVRVRDFRGLFQQFTVDAS